MVDPSSKLLQRGPMSGVEASRWQGRKESRSFVLMLADGAASLHGDMAGGISTM